MGLFSKSASDTALIQKSFCKAAFEQGMIEKLLCAEVGASPDEVIRETDYLLGWRKNTIKGKSFEDANEDEFYFTAMVYLRGRIAYLSQVISAKKLLQLQSDEVRNPRTGEIIDPGESEDITKDNADNFVAERFNKIIDNPDMYFGEDFYVCPVFYKDIELVRLMEGRDDGGTKVLMRMRSGFNYEFGVKASNFIQDMRSSIIDRNDIRFINARIAEAQMGE